MDQQKLMAARLRAAQAHPYLAGALWAMTIVPSYQVFTMAVDRYWRCYVSPRFVDQRTVSELAGAWLHEVTHLLRDHHARGDQVWDDQAEERSTEPRSSTCRWLDPDPERLARLRMNIAMDCEINDGIEGDGIRLPRGSLGPRQFGMSEGDVFENYLKHLPVSTVTGRWSWLDCGSGAHGGDVPWDLGPDGGRPLSPAQAGVIRIRVAEQIRRHPGRAPGQWSRWAENVGRPTQDWRRLLAAAIRSGLGSGGGTGDHTFRRPSRRAAALGSRVVLPAFARQSPEVAVVIDTSGSVGDVELGAALSETAGVITASGGKRVTVYSCDSAVQTVQSVSSASQIRLAGGGGTDLRRGMLKAMVARPVPDIVVVLTDGHTGWPSGRPPVPVVVGVLGPEPVLRDDGTWHPVRPPEWARTVRIGGT